MITTHNICLQCYADDSQLYVSFQPANETLERCIEDLREWMKQTETDSKPELLIFWLKIKTTFIKNNIS